MSNVSKASAYVTAKDLLLNKFTVTVHKAVLHRFLKAVRQRQVVLSQYGIPAEVLALIPAPQSSSSVPADAPGEGQPACMSEEEYENTAYCFYHFITFKLWESERATKLWEIEKLDFEDSMTKSVQCYQSKLALTMHCVMLRATVGYKIAHSVVWCAPPGAIAELLPGPEAVKPHCRVLSTSHHKFSTGDALRGSWHVWVDLRRALLPSSSSQKQTAATTSCAGTTAADIFCRDQLADVVECVVSVKVRHELAPVVYAAFGKLPLDREAADDDDDFAASRCRSDDKLFRSAVRWAPLEWRGGAPDPVPLPRSPLEYPLPSEDAGASGPVIPPYVPFATPAPRVVTTETTGAPAVFDVTPLSMKSNQTLGGTTRCLVSGKDTPCYTQYIDLTVRILNRTSETQVFEPPQEAYCITYCAESVSQGEGVCVRAKAARWDAQDGVVQLGSKEARTVCVRCEYDVRGRKPGCDNFERSQLDANVFPQPAAFRVVLSEAHSGASVTCEFVQYNKDRELPTQQTYLEKHNLLQRAEQLLLFLSADHCDKVQRWVVGVHLDEDDKAEKKLVIATLNQTSAFTLSTINRIGYEALMAGEERHALTDSYFDTNHIHVSFLCSHSTYPPMVYGLRIEVIGGEGSRSVGYCHIRFTGDDWFTHLEAPAQGVESTSVTRSSNAGSALSSWTSVGSAAKQAIVSSGDQPYHHSGASVCMSALSSDPQAQHTPSATDKPTGSSDAASPSADEIASGGMVRSYSTSMGYRIQYDEPLGSGAFGNVYRAFDLQSGKTVAVKETFLRSTAGSGSSVATSSSSASSVTSAEKKEFDVLMSCNHDNIVKVYAMDVANSGSVLRVFMEWVPGGSAATLMRRTHFRLHENVIRLYAKDALQGLAYLHDRGILHLDVKPGNMLVTHEGRVKLADFGTTALLTQGTTTLSTQHIVGTPAYMAPEIISSGKYYRGSDVWAWACCVVELATGSAPWSHLSPSVFNAPLPLMFHIASAKSPHHCPVVPDHLSGELRDILSACFSPTLSLRPSAETLLQTEYFSRATLPLDAEPMTVFYDAAQDARPAASDLGSDTSVGGASSASYCVPSFSEGTRTTAL